MVSALAVSSLRVRAYDSALWVLAAASGADLCHCSEFKLSAEAEVLGQDPGTYPAKTGALAQSASEERQGMVRNGPKL